jgi:hypothetical protein
MDARSTTGMSVESRLHSTRIVVTVLHRVDAGGRRSYPMPPHADRGNRFPAPDTMNGLSAAREHRIAPLSEGRYRFTVIAGEVGQDLVGDAGFQVLQDSLLQ